MATLKRKLEKVQSIEDAISRCWFEIDVLTSCIEKGTITEKYRRAEERKLYAKMERLGKRKSALVADL